jgi:hypothetical protein
MSSDEVIQTALRAHFKGAGRPDLVKLLQKIDPLLDK